MTYEMGMAYEIRPLTAADAEMSFRLGAVAFGYGNEPMSPMPLSDAEALGTEAPEGRTSWGAFTADGRLVAKAIDLEQSNWYGGRLVPASGIAGVAVAAEVRSQGVAQAVLTRLLESARVRGAVISTLFGTTPVPYRRLGYEEVGALYAWALPTMSLASMRIPAGYATRAATAADVPAIFDLYQRVARAGNGVQDRVPSPDILTDYHGTSLVVDDTGTVQGFCTWDRSEGYGANGTLTVDDLVALTLPALTALLAMIGTWAQVAPHLVLSLPLRDPAFSVIPLSIGVAHSRRPWMLRVIDAPAAIAVRGWPGWINGSVDLAIDDRTCPWNSGAFRLTVIDGLGVLEPGGTGSVRVGARGLAALYAGSVPTGELRRAGLLSGGDHGTDGFLDAVASGPAPTLRDYF